MAFSTALFAVAGGMAALQAVGQVAQGFADKEIADRNADLAQLQADQAREIGARHERAIRKQGRRLQGDIIVATASQGAALTGSPLELLADAARESELQALDARFEAETKARGLEEQARLDKQRGKNAVVGGFVSAGSTLVRTGTSILGAYGPFSRPGAATFAEKAG